MKSQAVMSSAVSLLALPSVRHCGIEHLELLDRHDGRHISIIARQDHPLPAVRHASNDPGEVTASLLDGHPRHSVAIRRYLFTREDGAMLQGELSEPRFHGRDLVCGELVAVDVEEPTNVLRILDESQCGVVRLGLQRAGLVTRKGDVTPAQEPGKRLLAEAVSCANLADLVRLQQIVTGAVDRVRVHEGAVIQLLQPDVAAADATHRYPSIDGNVLASYGIGLVPLDDVVLAHRHAVWTEGPLHLKSPRAVITNGIGYQMIPLYARASRDANRSLCYPGSSRLPPSWSRRVLVYQATKREFMDDVDNDAIAVHIQQAFERKVHRANPREVAAWRNSMGYMYKVLNTSALPDDCGVAIEFTVPYTSSRIDFLLTGRQDGTRDTAVIVELKQWQELEAIRTKDGLVRTFVGGAHRETAHPSYQAWSYARMIEDYNESVRNAEVELVPCAYLHNYRESPVHDPLRDPVYLEYLEHAPVARSWPTRPPRSSRRQSP